MPDILDISPCHEKANHTAKIAIRNTTNIIAIL
jgi:hypothetical protein